MKTLPLSVVAAAGVLLPGVLRSGAESRSWVPLAGPDNWFTAGNWTPAGTPAAVDQVVISNFGTANIASAGALAAQVLVGTASDGHLIIKPALGGFGRPSLAATEEAYVGDHGAAGEVIVSDADWSNDSRIWVGRETGSSGSVHVDTGGTVTSDAAYFAFLGTGAAVVTGAGSRWTIDGTDPASGLFLGFKGTASLSVLAGAKVLVTNRVIVGPSLSGDPGEGTVLLDGQGLTGTTLKAGSVLVGVAGAGELTVKNAALLEATGNIQIANQSTGEGTLKIGDGTSAGQLQANSIFMGDGTALLDVNITTPFVLRPNVVRSGTMGSATIRKDGVGKLTIAGKVDKSVTIDFVAGQLSLGDGVTSGVYDGTISTPAGSSVFFNPPGSDLSALILTGGGAVTKEGNGTYELINEQTITGPLTVQNGTLGLVTSDALQRDGGPTHGVLGAILSVNIDTFGNGAPAVMNVDGAGCSVTATQSTSAIGCLVGNSHAGTLNLRDGAAFTNQIGYVGVFPTAAGTVLVDDSTWTNLDDLTIGGSGHGTVTVQNGGHVTSHAAFIGKSAPATSAGLLVIKDIDSTLNTGTFNQTIGDAGKGAMELRAGGTATTTGGGIVGNAAAGNGTVLITDAGSAWNNGGLSIGPSGTGVVTVADGGDLNQPSSVVTVGRNPGGNGRLRYGAGGPPGSVNATGIQLGRTSAANSGNGTLEFNHTGTFPFSLPVTGFNGTLLESGPGTTVVTGNHTFTGVITITGGCLQADGTFPNVTAVGISSGGTLCGRGSIGKPATTLTVAPGGTLAPTPGQTLTLPGTVINNGRIRLSGGAVLTAASVVNNGILDLITAGSNALPPGFTNNGIILDAASVKIAAVTTTGGTISVSVPARAGHTWQLQRTPSLTTGPWIDIGSSRITASDETLTFTDATPPSGGAFYRLKITP